MGLRYNLQDVNHRHGDCDRVQMCAAMNLWAKVTAAWSVITRLKEFLHG